MNQKNNAIIVSAMSSSKTFANYKELNSFVDSIPGHFSPLEYAAKQKRDVLDAGITPPPSDLPAPKPPTRFDDQVAEREREEEEAETVCAQSKEAWFSWLSALEAEAARRFHGASGNTTELSRFQLWLEDSQAEARNLELAFQKAARKLQRARAGANALKIARDRWRQEQRVRFSYEGETLTLGELTERRKREVR